MSIIKQIEDFFHLETVHSIIILLAVPGNFITFYWAKYIGRKKEEKQKVMAFYDAIEPSIKTISSIIHREGNHINSADVQEIIQKISENFSQAFLKNNNIPSTIKQRFIKTGTKINCGVCKLDIKLVGKDQCPNCNLDCCTWTFEN